MRNIDNIDTFHVQSNDETIAEPCFNCPYDCPRICDCEVCDVEDEDFDDSLDDYED